MFRVASLTGLAVAVVFVSIVAAQDQGPPAAPAKNQRSAAAEAKPAAPAAPPAAAALAPCPLPGAGAAAGTAPTLDAIQPGFWVTGTASKSAKVVICVGKNEVGTTPDPVAADPNGSFKAQLTEALKKGDTVTALERSLSAAGATFSPSSKEVVVGDPATAGSVACSTPSKTITITPTLKTIEPGTWIDGTVPTSPSVPTGAEIVLCVDGQQRNAVGASGTIWPDGSFHVGVEPDPSQAQQAGKNNSSDSTPPLQAGQKVEVQMMTPSSAGAPAAYGPLSAPVTVGASAASFDFGRVRIYLSAGAILSQDQGEFSKTSTYLDFTSDAAWHLGNHRLDTQQTKDGTFKRGYLIDSLFTARLTALPTTTCETNTPNTTNNPNCTNDTSATPSLSTPKAALIEAGLYAPFYFGWSSWKFDDHRHALYLAPITKGGFQTLVQSAQSSANTSATTSGGSAAPTAITTIDGNTFFHFVEFGGRFGLFKFHDESTGVAPDQLMYLDISGGRFQNFPSVNSAGAVAGYPWRLSMEGRFMVPKIPVFVGFNSNTRPGRSATNGNAPGDLRFLFGTSFDLGCLLQKVGVSNPGVAACDSKKSSSGSTKSPS